MKIAILGGGSFGTALSVVFSKNGHNVKIWEFVATQADEMQKTRICPMLPEVKIPNEVIISSDMQDIVPDSEIILLVVPSDKVEGTIKSAKELITDQKIIICSKGFGENQKFLTDVVRENITNPVYCLYGPTLAKEMAEGEVTGMVLAGKNDLSILEKEIKSDSLKIQTTDDIIGVQIGAALKNVVTIFVGIVEGLGMGDNTKAYVFVKGIEEIKKIGLELGAKEKTFLGLTCVGDLTLNSRNRKLGIEIGKGRKLEDILKEANHVSEGVLAIKNAVKLGEKLDLDLTLINGLYKILFENTDPIEILRSL